MPKERAQPRPPEEPLDLGVEVAVNRCPYCHADVTVAEDPWVACKSCLARHHVPCWDELARCGSCGESVAISEKTESETRRSSPRLVPLLLAVLALFAGIATLAVRSAATKAAQAKADAAMKEARRTIGEATRSDDVTRWFPGIVRGLALLSDEQLNATEVGFHLDEFKQGARYLEETNPTRITADELEPILTALKEIQPRHRMLRVVQAIVGHSDLRFGEDLDLVNATERDPVLSGEVPVPDAVTHSALSLFTDWYASVRGHNPAQPR